MPGTEDTDKESVWPAHTGLLLEITGTVGKLPTASVVTSVAEPQALVTVNAIAELVALA